jgi:hypothetical protein
VSCRVRAASTPSKRRGATGASEAAATPRRPGEQARRSALGERGRVDRDGRAPDAHRRGRVHRLGPSGRVDSCCRVEGVQARRRPQRGGLMRRGIFAEVRDRLDVRDVAEQAGLTRRRQNFDCPACSGRLKARPAEGQGWYRVKCLPRCESVDLPAETRGLHRAAALHTARQLADLKPLWTGYAQPVPQLGPAPPSPPVLAGGGPRGATPDALQRVASLRPDRWLRRPLRHFVPGRASGPCGACRRAEASQCPRRPCKERAAARRPP